ncbi:hypothetical protein NL676_008113 [Syzygium grande]|nr:hypothetical protein NL676_008113 [Syzygium grande]
MEEVVIVGAGFGGGLVTAVALEKVGVQALVLEKSQELRATGAALGLYPNAWVALDALGFPTSSPPFMLLSKASWRPATGELDLARALPMTSGEVRQRPQGLQRTGRQAQSHCIQHWQARPPSHRDREADLYEAPSSPTRLTRALPGRGNVSSSLRQVAGRRPHVRGSNRREEEGKRTQPAVIVAERRKIFSETFSYFS